MNLRSVALVTLALVPSALAADHRDGVSVLTDPSTDIADVYSWMPDATHLAVVMTVSPSADATSKFSTSAKYVIHTSSRASYGAAADPEVNLICTFDQTQVASCWFGSTEYVTGDASATTGLTSTDGKMKIFAGLRSDPFAYSLTGFNHFRSDLLTLGPQLGYDSDGCPSISAGNGTHLVSDLNGGANDFATANVLSIVATLDLSLVSTSGHPIIGVWGSTHQ